jgi:hypothetical protein
MSLLGVASNLGITQIALQELLSGNVSPSISRKLGTTQRNVKDFIEGKARVGMASAIGVTTHTAQELRDRLDRQGAIGLIIGLCLAKSS